MHACNSDNDSYSISISSGLVTLLLLVLGVPVPAYTQTLEEVIVTAQRREQSVQDTPIAISAFSGDQLATAGVVNMDTLQDLVPNMNVTSEGLRDGVIITMRGVAGTDVRNSADPTTAFHVDGNYVPRLQGANAYFFDVDRVEVLRGPQGTLYGRNSTGGVVNVITKKPVLGEFSADVEAGFGSFNDFQVRGGVNIPLSENVATRLAFVRQTRDGYITNGGPGSARVTEDANDADELSVRGHLLWEISSDTSALFTAEAYKRGGVGQANSFIGPVPDDIQAVNDARSALFGFAPAVVTDLNGNPFSASADPNDTNPLNTQGTRDDRDYNFRFELTHDFGFMQAYYQVGYRSNRRFFVNDNDGQAAIIDGVETTNSNVETAQSDVWSNELRFSGDVGPVSIITGAYWSKETNDSDFTTNGTRDPARNAMVPGVPGPVSTFGFDRQNVRFTETGATNKTVAAFFNVDYHVTEKLDFTAGVRWTEDKKDSGGEFGDPTRSFMEVSFINSGVNGDPTGRVFTVRPGSMAVPGVNGSQVGNFSWDKLTWKVGASYNFNEDVMTYASFSTGFKSGGYNRGSQGLTLDGTLVPFQPEEIDAIEAGVKATFLDGRARVNFTGFYYDYTGLQQQAIITSPIDGTTTNTTFNAAAAEVWGLELESALVFGESGSISLTAGYIDTEFTEFADFLDPFTETIIDLSGNELPKAPEFNLTASVIPMTFRGLKGTWTPQVTVHYETEMFFNNTNFAFEERGDFATVDTVIRYDHEGGQWYGEFYGRNLSDKNILDDFGCGDIVSSGSSRPDSYLGCDGSFRPPRTFGVRIGFRM